MPSNRSPLFALTGVLLLVGSPPSVATAQLRPAPVLQEAYFAWDEGRYVEAMEGYLEVLRGPDGGRHVREAALLTGELHPVRELDDDGRFLRISPDGAWLAWARELDGEWLSRIVRREDMDDRIELPARDVAFSATGRVAYHAGGRLVVRDLRSGSESGAPAEGLRLQGLTFSPDGSTVYLAAGREGGGEGVSLFSAEAPRWTLEEIDAGLDVATDPFVTPDGRYLVFSIPARSPFAERGPGAPAATAEREVGVIRLRDGVLETFPGESPSVARNGSFIAWTVPASEEEPSRIMGARLDPGAAGSGSILSPRLILEDERPLAFAAVSPDGQRVAYQTRPHTDWEIFTVPTEGSGAPVRVSREIQHDQFPAWISDRHILAMKGEARHRRSYLYDIETGEEYRLFHNNTLRTIAPEYEWLASPDGSGVFVTAERDGNTIAPERGVWWIDLEREVSREELVDRLEANLRNERDLLERGRAAFEPIAEEVEEVTRRIAPARVYHYANALYDFGSKFVTQPGNALAIEYLSETLESWGYEVELQWFEASGRGQGARTANVVATLPGTENPELVYVISSHFDSVLPSPGADDDTSGTTALLEAARVMADSPRRATVQFAFLTGEEAGLLGAREFVRRAVEEGKRIAGVLNNDMIGWTRSHRLDNTVRYSNPGIKDIQHAASHYFSDLITYDALYYRGTDAGVFYQEYGDIVGGIGSYPVLGNPNYHQFTDQIETINHRLVAEVSRTTVATMMLLADSPSRLEGVEVVSAGGGSAEIRWNPAPEAGVREYRVRYGPPESLDKASMTVHDTRVRLDGLDRGSVVEVKAVGALGLEGWDWARVDPAAPAAGSPLPDAQDATSGSSTSSASSTSTASGTSAAPGGGS